MKYGFCLSGGGIRCVAQLGAIKAFQEKGISPSVLSGTSGGAIMGAFIAAGYTPEKVLEIVMQSKFLSSSMLQFRKAGLFSMRFFQKAYNTYLPLHIEELKIPLVIASTNISKGESVYFTKGNLAKAIMASSSIPLVFQPVEWKGNILVDGGVLDNFPAAVIKDKCDKLIGVHVNAKNTHQDLDIKMMTIVDSAFHLLINKSVYPKAAMCDLFLDPPDMLRFGMLDTRHTQEIFETGYDYTKKQLADPDILDGLTKKKWGFW